MKSLPPLLLAFCLGWCIAIFLPGNLMEKEKSEEALHLENAALQRELKAHRDLKAVLDETIKELKKRSP